MPDENKNEIIDADLLDETLENEPIEPEDEEEGGDEPMLSPEEVPEVLD